MSYTETNFNAPVRHNPYLHEIVIKELSRLKPGRILDLPSGPGYLIQDLKKLGFNGVAGEIDNSLHCLQDIDYKSIDMTQRFDFPDGSFDFVTSIEGIEHIENHFYFLREVRRVLKKGGKLYLTTPNIHSLESRLMFFLSGFHSLAAHPIPLDTPNIYFEHINPISIDRLYFICERVGLKVTELKTYRYRKGSKIFYYLFYPLIMTAIRAACFAVPDKQKKANQPLYKFLASKENLLGSHTILVAEAK